MTRVIVRQQGLQKISFTKLLQSEIGIRLDAAKHLTDEMLEKGHIELTFETHAEAERFAAKATAIGALVEFSRVSGGRI